MAGDSIAGEQKAPSVASKCEIAAEPEVVKTATPASHHSEVGQRPILYRSQTNPGPITSGSPRFSIPSGRRSQGHDIMVHPNNSIRTWQRLEALRMRKLGIPMPRSFMVARTYGYQPIDKPRSTGILPPLNREATMSLICQPNMSSNGCDNGVSPFKTLQKPTCGYFFSFGTNHRKIRHGLTPADIPKWRSMNFTSP